MELVLHIESQNLAKVKDILLKDDVVSRASMILKDAKQFDKEGYYYFISGTNEQCKKAVELTKDFAKVLEGKEKDNVISKIKEEESKASEAFGGIFG